MAWRAFFIVSATMAEVLLETHDLVKRFGGLVAIGQANLTVLRGEIHALIGPNGAGKTTLIHLISGALRSDSGSIRFKGAEIARVPMHRRVAAGLARSYQVTSIFKRFTVLENVAFAVQARGGQESEAQGVLEEVDLTAKAHAIAGELAHGEQRRLEVALCLATGAELLLLDEPMAGLDQAESSRMVELLRQLGTRSTLLLVEHDMDAVFRLAHRISALVSGNVIATGTPDEIRSHPGVKEAYLGSRLAA